MHDSSKVNWTHCSSNSFLLVTCVVDRGPPGINKKITTKFVPENQCLEDDQKGIFWGFYRDSIFSGRFSELAAGLFSGSRVYIFNNKSPMSRKSTLKLPRETTLNQGPLMLDLQKTPRCIEGERSCHDTIIVAIEVLVPWQWKNQ